MQIAQSRLRQIIVEEYIKEEGLEESQAAEDLLRQLIGDEEYERRRALENPDSRGGDTAAMDKPNKAAETMPMPSDQPNPIKTTVDGIYELVADMDPEDVQEIFQIVFEKLPGVELRDAEAEAPETLYRRGADGRAKIRTFDEVNLKELKTIIRKVLVEGDYHDFGKPAYDVMKGEGPPEKAPFHDFSDVDDGSITDDDLSDLEDNDLLDIAKKDGIELHRYLSSTKPALPLSDEERARIIGAIKNV